MSKPNPGGWDGYLAKVSSGSLIYALNPDSNRLDEEEKKIARAAILNILEANRFDSIPLVNERNGPIVKIARRKFHDGDVANPDGLTLIEIPRNGECEVAWFKVDGDLLQAIIQVLGNEHHIAMIGDSIHRAKAVLSIAMLTSPLVKAYLPVKIAELTKEHGLDGAADKGLDIYERICELAALVKDGDSNSDEVVTEAILRALQPLQIYKSKEIGSTNVDEISIPSITTDIMSSNIQDLEMKHIVQWPMAGVKQQSGGVDLLAARMLNIANNFTNILHFSDNGSVSSFRFKDGKKTKGRGHLDWESTPVTPLDPSAKIETLVSELVRNQCAISVRTGVDGSIEYGIVSEDEMAHWILKYHLMIRFSELEEGLRDVLKKFEGRELEIQWKGSSVTKLVDELSLGQVLRVLNNKKYGDWFRYLESVEWRDVGNFRNELVHELRDQSKMIKIEDMKKLIELEQLLE